MLQVWRRTLAITFIFFSIIMLTACGSDKPKEDQGITAAELYERAKLSSNNGSYERAIILYRQLQSRFPFGRYAEQSQLELAYAYYKRFEPDLSISTLDRFIRTYPTHPHVDYAHYLKGLVNFSRDRGLIARLLPDRTSDRDQEFGRQAFQDFAELIQRFPDSQYVDDARERMVFLRDAMASYELTIAQYYKRRGANIAAANRAKNIVETYQGTRHIADALAIMAEAYKELELQELSDDAYRVLELNYPEHPLLTGRYEEKSFLDKLWPFD